MKEREIRIKRTVAFILSAAVIFSLNTGVSAEDLIVSEGSPDQYSISDPWDVDTVEEIEEFDSVNDTSEKADSEYLNHGYNMSPSANTYCGVIFVREDGLFDKPQGGQEVTVSGMTYDPSAHTMSLNNVNLGCVYDDILRHDKNGVLVFYDKQNDKKSQKEKDDDSGYTNYKIVLTGHNYIGGYSTFERRNGFWGDQWVEYGNDKYYTVTRAMQGMALVTFEGEGDITINGQIGVRIDTEKTVWYSDDDDGVGIISTNKAEKIKILEKQGKEYNGMTFGGGYDDVPENAEQPPTNYLKIGGDKPDVPDKTLAYIDKTVSIGEIGGHKVSVEFVDNIPYDGRAILPESSWYTITRINKDGSKETIIDEDYLSKNYAPDASKSARYEFDVEVNVDDEYFYSYSKKLAKHYNEQSKKLHSINVKIKNNRDVPDLNSKKPKIPSFTLSIRKESGLDQNFIKEFNDYFKKNPISFNIIPCDIRYAETTFLGKTGYIPDIDPDPDDGGLEKAEKYRQNMLKSNLKIEGNTIKNISLFGPRLEYDINKDKGGTYSKKLKIDKKYNPDKPNLKKDFHAEISGNYIVLTGQGNYTGTVIVNNPLINDDKYFRDADDHTNFNFFLGTIYDYWDPNAD
ncbi:MAG: hypothetical protein K6A90_00360 [Lachnospiraceae bacterium]|nr:hypothetical protein [Lachnospiraceae bacterium]